jgi:hypothetical protein
MDIKELQRKALEQARLEGKWDGANIRESIWEICEAGIGAMNLYNLSYPIDKVVELDHKESGVPVYFADMVIDIAAFCEYFDIDLKELIEKRLKEHSE